MFCLISHFSRGLSTKLENSEYPQPVSRQHTETEAQQAAAAGAPPCSHSLRSLHSCRAQPCPRGGRGLFGTIFGIFKATSIISSFKTPSLAPFLPKECGQHKLCRQ